MLSKNNQPDKELARCEAITRTILAAVCEGIIVQDREGKIILANEKGEEIAGPLLREDGSPCPKEQHPSSAALATGKPVTGAILGYRRPDGEIVRLSVNTHPVFPEEGSEPVAVVTAFSVLPGQKAESGPAESGQARDPLTGAYSRNKFLEALDLEMKRTTRYLTPLSLLLVDIDGIEGVNQTYGRRQGDYVLVTVVEIINECIRKTDCISRWEEEEFMVLLPNTTDEDGFYLAERIRRAVEDYSFEGAGREGIGRVTCSLGICEYMPSESEDGLLKRMRAALAGAKEKGRNRVESG